MEKRRAFTKSLFRKLKIQMAIKGLTMKEITNSLGVNYRYFYIACKQGNDISKASSQLREIYGIKL